MAKVSVVVPVYGVEKHIEKCVESLFEQSLDDVEFIFVNDCTSDSSMDVLKAVIEKYPTRKECVKCIDLETNRGQAFAFKVGIMHASGEYLIKCDSDDTIHPDMYKMMYEQAKKDELDMVVCDMALVYLKGNRVYPNGARIGMPGCYPGLDGISALLGNRIPSSVCNKLIRRSILEDPDFIFPVDPMCEDLVYSIQYETKSKKKGYIRECYYNYYRYPESYTWNQDFSSQIKKHLQLCGNVRMVFEILERNGLQKKYSDEIIHQCLFAKTGLKSIIRHEGVYEMWKNTFREANWKIPFCRSIPFKERGLYLLYYFHLDKLYHRFKNKLR